MNSFNLPIKILITLIALVLFILSLAKIISASLATQIILSMCVLFIVYTKK